MGIICLLFTLISLSPYLMIAYQLHENPLTFEPEPIPEPNPNPEPEPTPEPDNEGNDEYVAENVYYVEAFHGGLMLGENVTYENLDLLFDALEKYPYYKVSFEIESFTWELLNGSYVDRVKEYVDQGRIEMCLTAYSQPFLSNLTYEYAFWQLQKGKETIERIFNVTPQVYVCQEPSLRYDLPKLLTEVGIKAVYGRISWSFFGNVPYWSLDDVLNQDLVKWKYNEYEVILIPYYYKSNSAEWEFFNTQYLLDFARGNGIHHPFQSCINDLAWWEIYGSDGKGQNYYRWNPERPLPLYQNEEFKKINDPLTIYTTFSEYINKIADEAKDTIELDESYFVLNLPDKQEYINETHTKTYDKGIYYNVSQFQYLWTKTKELEYLWLDIYKSNTSDPRVDELGFEIAILFHHDIWVCYHMSGWGMAHEEGFEDWYAFWLYYYQLTVDFLSSYNITIT